MGAPRPNYFPLRPRQVEGRVLTRLERFVSKPGVLFDPAPQKQSLSTRDLTSSSLFQRVPPEVSSTISIIFLFVRHPFDVGDKIDLGVFTVKEILLSTILLNGHGGYVQVSSKVLADLVRLRS